MRKTLLAWLITICLPCCFAQQGTIHGNGDPRTFTQPPNCAASRFYVDDATGNLYIAASGSPCTWAPPGGASGGNPTQCVVNTANTKCVGVAPYTVSGDATAALQSAINDLVPAGGGDVYIPCGTFNLNGPLQDTSHANAVILLPTVNETGPEIPINLHGCSSQPVGGPNSGYGTILQTAITAGNLFGGYDVNNTLSGPFTQVRFGLDRLTLRGPSDPNIEMVNAEWIYDVDWKHLRCDTVSPLAYTHSSAVCFQAPAIGSGVTVQLDDIQTIGFYTDYILGEHAHAFSIRSGGCVDCLIPDVRRGVPNGNTVQVDQFWCQSCTNPIVAGTTETIVNIGALDAECSSGNGVKDPTGLLRGSINWHVPYNCSGATLTQTNLNVSGGSNLHLWNLYNSSCAGVGCGSSATSTLVRFWRLNEASGTTAADSSTTNDAATLSGGSWTTEAGLSGGVYSFNGTSTFGLSASNTSANFDHNQPFTTSVWADFSSGTTEQTLVGDLDTANNFRGWELHAFPVTPTGNLQVDLFLISNYPSNALDVRCAAFAATSGKHMITFSYDGSGAAAGVKCYMDGTLAASVALTDALTTTTTNTLPLRLGDRNNGTTFFSGKMGPVGIWNRVLTSTEVGSLYANPYTIIN